MVSFKMRLADKVIEVNVNYPSTKEFCRNYLTDEAVDFSVTVGISDVIAEEVASQAQENSTAKFPPQYLETLALYRKIAKELASYGIILFHGSAVSLDGEAYIFTAKSGTGKSTHTALWRKAFGNRAVMINDDKPLIAVGENGVTVYGTPWCGKHNLGSNISAPLKAMCILERGDNNSIQKITAKDAFSTLFSQTYRFDEPSGMRNVLSCIDKMVNFIPTYRLKCNMNDDAAIIAYQGMKGE